MTRRTRSRFLIGALGVLLALGGAPEAKAQNQTGNLYCATVDSSGNPLVGVTVTLSGIGAPQVQQANAEGAVRFLGLSPGQYSVRAELDGFLTASRPSVTIAVGRNTNIELRLATNAEDITGSGTVVEGGEIVVYAGESALLDPTKINIGSTISQTELEKIPSSRDPWAILQTVPGVLVDRINVGGNESGQQSTYVSPGTNADNSVWAVDGVVITDMGSIGSSPSYYNFDSFEEMQVTTGGSDVGMATGGVTMNMVTKRGTNDWRFSGRYLLTDEGAQSDLDFATGDLANSGDWNRGNSQDSFKQGNRIVEVLDFGLEGGGPIVKDKVWIWGSYGEQEVDLLTISDVSDFTDLESYAAKLNAQLSPENSLIGFYHYGDKVKIGRDAGPLRPADTTWNQAGPTDIYKLEDSHVFGSSFYLTGLVSYVGGGFELVPQGGGIGDPSFPNVVRQSDLVWQNSFLIYQTDRPQQQAKLDGTTFLNTGSASHELRFGVGYRTVEVDSYSVWPGQQLVGRADISLGGGQFLGLSVTERNTSLEADYTEVFVQDTVTLGNLTANLGLRYDVQDGRNNATTVRAAPFDADGVLIGGNFQGGDAGFDWTSFSPRLGLTYALGSERQTLLRASYSQFADQLGSGPISQVNPALSQAGFFVWQDDGDQVLTEDEIGPFFSFGGVDPNNPGLQTVSLTDPDLDAPTTDELVLGIEHALRPELVIGLNVTARRYTDVLEFEPLVLDANAASGDLGRPHRRDDYVLSHRISGTLPSGSSFDVPLYTLRDGLTSNGGSLLTNGERSNEYLATSLTFNKRLSNRWMLRGHVTWSDWTWDVPDSEREDPTQLLPGNTVDGGAVLIGGGNTSGPKGDVFINSNWSYDLSGMVQIAPDRPWGFNLAGNLNGREGYPLPYNVAFDPQDGIGTRNVLVVDDVESLRVDDIHVFNARLEKEIPFNDFGLTLSVDGFNLFNESTVLQRSTAIAGTVSTGGGTSSAGSTSGDYVREILSPRIFRVGARISFR